MPEEIPKEVKMLDKFAFTVTKVKIPNPSGPDNLEINIVKIN